MQHLNKTHFKRLKNLRSGYYFKPQKRIEDDEFISWVTERMHVMSHLVEPLAGLLERLTLSWGAPGEPGDLEEMHETCVLISDLLEEMVNHEEILRFTQIPDEGLALRDLFVDTLAANFAKLEDILEQLNDVVSIIGTDHGGTPEKPKIFAFEITFELPEGFERDFEYALKDYTRFMGQQM